MRIDCKGLDFAALNEKIRGSMDAEIELTNVLGQRYIGSGLSGKNITADGVPGNALGAYMAGGTITVHGNAQDAVGDTMNSGSIVVAGHAGDTVGYAMRGGEILVRDYAGFRVGIHMKEYGEHVPVIVVGGTAGDFLGEYMAGGIIAVLGIGSENACPVGNFCATGQYGGRIYIRSRFVPEGLPPQVEAQTHADITPILPLIKRYCAAFGGDCDALARSDYILLTPSTSNIYKRLYCNRTY